MLSLVSRHLRIRQTDLRIYNLVRPSKGLGMSLPMKEFDHLEDTILRIKAFVRAHRSVTKIVVGGKSGPMPQAALLLKLVVPRVRIEVRNHHRARAVNGGALTMVRVIRP